MFTTIAIWNMILTQTRIAAKDRDDPSISVNPYYHRVQVLRLKQASIVLHQPLPTCPNRRRRWHPTPVLLPGKSHGQRSLVGCSPWGHTELDTTEQIHFHFSFSCIAEGNGNPLQCSCLENPRDGGAWWAAVSGVTQSPTQLKQLSSSRNLP